MKLNLSLIKRVLWPERASLFVVIGGAAGMAADLTSFLADFISPTLLAATFGGVALICTLLCLQRAALVDPSNHEAVEEVIGCRVCDGMRFGLFAAAAFTLLLFIGQGQSATEKLVESLGLIQRDVAHISTEVSELSDVAQSSKLIPNPRSAEEFFRNAWIHSNIHRNPSEALKALEAMYEKDAPSKIDAAELFYNTGRQIKSREDLLGRMEYLGKKHEDATLLVIAARNATSPEEGERLVATARDIDPRQPFAYWDIMSFSAAMGAAGHDPQSQRAMIEKQVQGLEKFLEHFAGRPATDFFFLPQYQADMEMTARQTLGNLQSNLATYERMDAMKQNLEDIKKKRLSP